MLPRIRVKPRNPNFDIRNLFIQVYKAYPGFMFGRDDINLSNSVILPPSALQELSQLKNFGTSKDSVVLFKILNKHKAKYIYTLRCKRIHCRRRMLLSSNKYVR